MRVITGKYRAKRLIAPDGKTTRPTLQRAKEAMFNMSNQFFDGHAIDVFSGTGQLGIEALSRGCEFCHFNELDSRSKKQLLENLSTIERDSFNVKGMDYKQFIKTCRGEFELILIDPPYPIAEESMAYLLKYIDENNMLTADGMITGEMPATCELPDNFENIKIKKIKNFSKLTNIYQYIRK